MQLFVITCRHRYDKKVFYLSNVDQKNDAVVADITMQRYQALRRDKKTTFQEHELHVPANSIASKMQELL